MEQPLRQIPYQLQRSRKLAGLSQKAVADKLGLHSASVVSKWEKGLTRPTLEHLFMMARLYHVLADQLYFELGQEMEITLKERRMKLTSERINKRNNPP